MIAFVTPKRNKKRNHRGWDEISVGSLPSMVLWKLCQSPLFFVHLHSVDVIILWLHSLIFCFNTAPYLDAKMVLHSHEKDHTSEIHPPGQNFNAHSPAQMLHVHGGNRRPYGCANWFYFPLQELSFQKNIHVFWGQAYIFFYGHEWKVRNQHKIQLLL